MKEKLESSAESGRFRKIGVGSLVSASILIGAIIIAYAVTSITISNTGTVTSGANIFLAAPTCGTGASALPGDTVCVFSSPPTCLSGSGTYTATSGAITDWSVTQGGPAQNLYVCLQNTGTGSITVSVTWSAASVNPANGVSCTSPTTGAVPSGGFLAVNLQCSALSTATIGGNLNFGSFTIS